MGQTLSNGLYLPDEGERNSYSGLEANWRTLDALILTVNGKAAPNVANTWTAAQTFTAGITGDLTGNVTGNVTGDLTGTASKAIADEDGTSIKTGYVNVAGNQTVSGDKSFTGSNTFNNILPNATNSYALGSSSYQWSSVYAQSYYYNGTQWGLDKANVWTGSNTFTSTITTKTNVDRTVAPASDTTYGTIICRDKNGSAMFRMQGTIKTDLSNVWDMMMVAPNNSYITFFKYTISTATSDRELRFKAGSVIPDDNLTSNLGTSTNKWKTLNGINPGALSLPDYDRCVDKTSEIPVASLDGNTEIDINDYFPNLTGWINIVISDASGNFIRAVQGKAGTAVGFNNSRSFHAGSTGGGFITLFMPIVAGSWKSMKIQASSVTQFRFYPCLGNV